MSKKKGDRRERDAVEIYNGAGYRCERAVQANYGTRSDWFGMFDIMAMAPGTDFRLAQVKSNTASGVQDWMRRVERLLPPGLEADFLVCHDRQGWRMLRPVEGDQSYETVVDERKMDCNMGEGVRDWLKNSSLGALDADA